ncbi:MAG: aminodeoxychorismate synthase component I [Candidatus Omnitrophica bacterium]|nr:aminodeoxychorismate synthase component I [Candidatus Omnitrophota bacterium]
MVRNVIPVWRSFPLNGFAPVDIYEKVRGDHSFLLESVHESKALRNNGAGLINRYSFIGFDPYLIFKSKGQEIRMEEDGHVVSESGEPIKRLRELMNRFKLAGAKELPPFSGGAVGYLSYDARHFFERLPRMAPDDLRIPDVYFVFTDKVIAFDHYDKKFFIICQTRLGGYNSREAEKELQRLEKKIFSKREASKKNGSLFLGSKIESNFTRDEFKSMVKKAKEHIKCGDIYQANLSQRLSTSIEGDPLDLYKILRQINPSPFASYLDFDEVKIVSSSPERLLLVKGREVETRPIAGTRPRGRSRAEDKRLSRRLILSPKERAEHIMLVDLERNDLGRVCRYGTVEVNELMTLENYSHVIHIVSNVRGRLKPGMDRFSALAACFPGGTITGTPKIRSMEIIDELEKVARSIYTGSIGYFNYGGEMDLNIVIRTFVIADGHAYIQVGAGIVADSDPEREYYETLHKADALISAVRKVKLKNEALSV